MDRGFSYSIALKVSGNVCQWREYEKPVFCGGKGKERKFNEIEPSEEQRLKNLEFCQRRAKSKLNDIVNSNFGLCEREDLQGDKRVKFLTLTYKENMQDRKRLSYDWGLFVKRLEYMQQEKVSYITVPERQKRGAFHLHSILVSSFIDIEELVKIWNKDRGQGGINLKGVKDVANIGKYMSKYLSKDMEEPVKQEIAGGKRKEKRFFTSRDMSDKSEVFRFEKKEAERVISLFSGTMKGSIAEERKGCYTSEHVGKVTFQEVCLCPGRLTGELLDEFKFYAYPSRL